MARPEAAQSLGRPTFVARVRGSEAFCRSLDAVYAGLGGFLTIFVLAEMTTHLGKILLIAPFGASCVLVYALPQSPLAQPRNVIGGHLVSTCIGLVVAALLGTTPVAYGLGVGLAIAAMSLTRTLHPPAGADPIVVIMTGASWPFLFVPVLVGALVVVLMAAAFRRWATRKAA